MKKRVGKRNIAQPLEEIGRVAGGLGVGGVVLQVDTGRLFVSGVTGGNRGSLMLLPESDGDGRADGSADASIILAYLQQIWSSACAYRYRHLR